MIKYYSGTKGFYIYHENIIKKNPLIHDLSKHFNQMFCTYCTLLDKPDSIMVVVVQVSNVTN